MGGMGRDGWAWPAWVAPGMEGLGGVAGQSYKIVGTVDWNPQDQQRIRSEFYFSKAAPVRLAIRLAQEDYWVYQALLYIIKKTNGNASTHSAVAVKQINAMQIGARPQAPSAWPEAGPSAAGAVAWAWAAAWDAAWAAEAPCPA